MIPQPKESRHQMKRILAILALVGAGMIGGLMSPLIAGAVGTYDNSNHYQPAYVPLRVTERLQLTAGVPMAVTVDVVPHEVYTPPAAAVAVNLTVADPAAAGYVTAWPSGYPQPETSNVNFDTDETTSNFAIVPVVDGQIMVVSSVDAELEVDVFGSFDLMVSGPMP